MLHAACYDANRVLTRGEGWLDVPHASPHPDCQCGIYAYHRPGLRTYVGEVWWCEGVITAWGRIIVHGDGWRAEHARLEALAPPEVDDDRPPPPLDAIAARLGVPLVPRAALPEVAAGVGAPVPPALLPSA